MTLVDLQMKLEILAGSYQENFKYDKDLHQVLGAQHPSCIRLNAELNKIAEEMREVEIQIKSLGNNE